MALSTSTERLLTILFVLVVLNILQIRTVLRQSHQETAADAAPLIPLLSHRSALEESFGFFDDIPDHLWIKRRNITNAHVHNTVKNPRGKVILKNPPAWYQNNWNPDFACLHEARVGNNSNGHYVCDPHRLNKEGCLVYSFVGKNHDLSFESDLQTWAPLCEIHVFSDPEHIKMMDTSGLDGVNFHDWSIKPSYRYSPFETESEWFQPQGQPPEHECQTLEETMRELRHEKRRIDLFRMDCEGCEWKTYRDFLKHDIRQILVQTHHVVHQSDGFFWDLHRAGYAIFHMESLNGINAEFSLLKLSKRFLVHSNQLESSSSWVERRTKKKTVTTTKGPAQPSQAVKQPSPVAKRATKTKNTTNLHVEKGPAIAFLVPNITTDLIRLKAAIRSIDDHLADEQTTPLLLFNEGDLSLQLKRRVREITNREIRFPLVDFTTFPKGLPVATIKDEFVKRKEFGYWQMSRFWTYKIWHHKVLDGFSSIMRMDTDSCFTRRAHPSLPNIPNRSLHVYVANNMDHPSFTIHGLLTLAKRHIEAINHTPANMKLWNHIQDVRRTKNYLPAMYNNFEIDSIAFFRQPHVLKFLHSVSEEKPWGIFTKQWGDAPIRLLTLALFAKPDQVAEGYNTGYEHAKGCQHLWGKKLTAAKKKNTTSPL